MALQPKLVTRRPFIGVSKRVRHSCLRLKEVWRGARRFGAAYAEVDCVLLEHISLRVIDILFIGARKLFSVENAPSASGGR